MYTQFFRLNCKPFGVSPDPRFFYCGQGFAETLAALSAHFRDAGGMIVLTGGVGAGKTTVLNHMARNFPLLCYNKPALNIKEISRNIAENLGISEDGSDLSVLGRQLSAYQKKSSLEKRHEIFAFDDAHEYAGQVLLDLVRLQDAVMENGGRFTIVLAGDEALVGKIARLDLKKKAGHISYYTVENLAPKSAKAMVDHRLNIAGSSLLKVFSPDAIDEIYGCSKGIPRIINNICELSLIFSFNKQEKIVSVASIRMAARNIVNLDYSMASCEINKASRQSKKILPNRVAGNSYLPERKRFFVKTGWACSFFMALLVMGLTHQTLQDKTPRETAVEDRANASNNPESLLLPGPVGAAHDYDKEKVKPHAIALDDGLPDAVMGNWEPDKAPETEKDPDTVAQSKALAALLDFHEKKLAAIPKKNRLEIPAEKKSAGIIAQQPESPVSPKPTEKAGLLAKKKTERSAEKANFLKRRSEFKESVSVQPPQPLKLETNMALSKAIKNNDIGLVRQLLMQGADPDSTNEENLPLLIAACQQGCLGIAKLLLEKGASTEVKDQLGETALMKSVWDGSDKIVFFAPGLWRRCKSKKCRWLFFSFICRDHRPP